MQVNHAPILLEDVVSKRSNVTTQADVNSARSVFNATTALFVYMNDFAASESAQDALVLAEKIYSVIGHIFDQSPRKMLEDLNRTLAWSGFPAHIIIPEEEDAPVVSQTTN